MQLFSKYPLNQLSKSSSLLPGRQLRLLRLQGAERQQRGPVQTQLPDWLEQREVGDSSDEARLVSIIQTHLKLQQRTNYCTHKIFLLKKKKVKTNKKTHSVLLLRCTKLLLQTIFRNVNQHAARRAVESLHPNASSVSPVSPWQLSCPPIRTRRTDAQTRSRLEKNPTVYLIVSMCANANRTTIADHKFKTVRSPQSVREKYLALMFEPHCLPFSCTYDLSYFFLYMHITSI